MSDHKTNEMTYQEKLNAEFGRSKSAEEEKALLREQIVDLRKVNTQPSKLSACSKPWKQILATVQLLISIYSINYSCFTCYLVTFDCTFIETIFSCLC